jgi:hypothetical protein
VVKDLAPACGGEAVDHQVELPVVGVDAVAVQGRQAPAAV